MVKGPHLSVFSLKSLLARAKLKYPLICKPVTACGSASSHQLAIVIDERGLELISPPVVIQEYKNHDSVLYKAYVMGDKVEVFIRPSLPNIHANSRSRSILFDSQLGYPTTEDMQYDFTETIDKGYTEIKKHSKEIEASNRTEPGMCNSRQLSGEGLIKKNISWKLTGAQDFIFEDTFKNKIVEGDEENIISNLGVRVNDEHEGDKCCTS